MYRKYRRRRRGERHGVEALFGIVGHAVKERGVCGIARRDRQDRVAVGRSMRCMAGPDIAARSAKVFDIKLSPKRCRQALGENARQKIVGAAGSKRDDHTNRLDRILAGVGMACREEFRSQQRRKGGATSSQQVSAVEDHCDLHNTMPASHSVKRPNEP